MLELLAEYINVIVVVVVLGLIGSSWAYDKWVKPWPELDQYGRPKSGPCWPCIITLWSLVFLLVWWLAR